MTTLAVGSMGDVLRMDLVVSRARTELLAPSAQNPDAIAAILGSRRLGS